MKATGLEGDLLKTAQGHALLPDALATVVACREEQARVAAELLEREVWATKVLLEAAAGIWDRGAKPPLRFSMPSGKQGQWHLEFGRFGHLEALSAPSQAEQILLTAEAPCWARAIPDHTREMAGYMGELAYAYEPIPLAEAVSTIGFATILSQLEAAARAAGQALLQEAQALAMRQARLEWVERMLGWHEDPVPLPAHYRALRALLGPGCRWLVGAALLGLLTIPLCVFAGAVFAPLALVPAVIGLLVAVCIEFAAQRSPWR
jgi:hypothetical protein